MSPLDSISLEFFHKLSILLPKGRFRFKSSCKIYTLKKQAGNCLLEVEDLRDIIVQKGIAILLEILCEHRFYECSFGSRKGKSVHDALAYIKKKVPSGM
jgi:retron-type reverse transcriptase